MQVNGEVLGAWFLWGFRFVLLASFLEELNLFYLGGVELVGEAAGNALGRDDSRPRRHQLHYILPDHVGSGGSGSLDDCRE